MTFPQFKYFEHPEKFSVFVLGDTTCACCGQTRHCFDAGIFLGDDAITAICPDCLSTGKLETQDIFTCEGDMGELIRQIKAIYPHLSIVEVERLAREKTAGLEKTTPPLRARQEWSWPCIEGDYCRFVGFGSHSLYNRLAEGNDGEWLFPRSLYYTVKDQGDFEALWDEVMPALEIEDFEASCAFETLFYVFKSLHSSTVVTIWDVR